MKIDDSNTTINFLLDNYPTRYCLIKGPTEVDFTDDYMWSYFPLIRPVFRERIQFGSRMFSCAYRWAVVRAKEVLPRERIEASGTWVESFGSKFFETVFYQLSCECNAEGNYEGEVKLIGFYHWHNRDVPFLAYMVIGRRNSPVKSIGPALAIFEMTGQDLINTAASRLLFMKYCLPETKGVQAGGAASHAGVFYENDTAFPVSVVDCAWLTALTEGKACAFGEEDSGAFRLRPYGPELALQRLEWVASGLTPGR